MGIKFEDRRGPSHDEDEWTADDEPKLTLGEWCSWKIVEEEPEGIFYDGKAGLIASALHLRKRNLASKRRRGSSRLRDSCGK